MYSIGLLILFPLLAGLAVARAPDAEIRAQRVRWSAGAIAVATILLTLLHLGLGPEFYAIPGWLLWTLDRFFMLAGVALALVLLYFCRRIVAREWYIPVLILLQTGLMLSAELAPIHPEVAHPFYIDSFTLLMALIVGVVGGLICLHAVAYMRDYHAHEHDVADRQPAFYFVIFLFLAAMFGIVFTNHLTLAVRVLGGDDTVLVLADLVLGDGRGDPQRLSRARD
jgi:ech hydrogenase subunit A